MSKVVNSNIDVVGLAKGTPLHTVSGFSHHWREKITVGGIVTTLMGTAWYVC